jgi:D-alanyl-D-alanine carboxypeptidase
LLKNSQNLYAEMLFKRVSPAGVPASYAAAREVERRFLTREVGIDGRDFTFADGCGLATDDLVTPAAAAPPSPIPERSWPPRSVLVHSRHTG